MNFKVTCIASGRTQRTGDVEWRSAQALRTASGNQSDNRRIGRA